MRHEKKILIEHFQPILDGRKTYEVRLADWECKPGDVLVLREWHRPSFSTRSVAGRLKWLPGTVYPGSPGPRYGPLTR